MGFKYDRLWQLTKRKNLQKKELREQLGISQTTLMKLLHNENVSLDVIDKICTLLECTPENIMEYISETSYTRPQPKRGEVWNAYLESGNYIPAGYYPVLIYESREYIYVMPSVIVIPFTKISEEISSINMELPSLFDIAPLDAPSLLNIDLLQRVSKEVLSTKFGDIPTDIMRNIDTACMKYLGMKLM